MQHFTNGAGWSIHTSSDNSRCIVLLLFILWATFMGTIPAGERSILVFISVAVTLLVLLKMLNLVMVIFLISTADVMLFFMQSVLNVHKKNISFVIMNQILKNTELRDNKIAIIENENSCTCLQVLQTCWASFIQLFFFVSNVIAIKCTDQLTNTKYKIINVIIYINKINFRLSCVNMARFISPPG